MKKKNNILTIVLVILLLSTSAYIIYDKIFYKEKQSTVENDKIEVNEENLDVDSRLVQTLYNKVVGQNKWSKYWMYDNYLSSNNTSDYFVSKSDLETKINLVGNNVNQSKVELIECNNSIPNTIKIDNYDYISSCYAMSQGASYIPQAYDKNYIETIYKDLFGTDSVLDTSKDFSLSTDVVEIYHYIPSLDKYVLFVTEGGGKTSATSYSGVVVKAVKLGNVLEITENVTMTNPATIETTNYIYTFKLEDDGMYSFVSRVKEK